MAFCALLMASCAKQVPAIPPEVSAQYSKVSSERGSMFLNVKCDGGWTLSLQGDGAEVDWATLSPASGTGDKAGVVLRYEENATGMNRSLTVVVTSEGQRNSCMVTQLAAGETPSDKPGNQNPDDGDKDVSDFTKAGWLELPAMDDPSLSYYSHSFELNGRTWRNYTFGYSKKDYLAVWVAYPLSNFYLQGNPGESEWVDNPLVENEYEPNYSRSFGFKSGYERGHQIANADRKCCHEANQQTYYYTNATLQHKDFNGPVWGVLEGNIRAAAKSADTLYVVTGCVLPDSPKYITDYDGRNVPVPSGYFKAALRYHKASTRSVWMGAAFYMDHDASKYPSKQITTSESMSISELEAMLGLDLFVGLPLMVGEDMAAAIEAQNPDSYSSVWGIR